MYARTFLKAGTLEDPHRAIDNGCETEFYFMTSLGDVDIFGLVMLDTWVPYPILGYARICSYQLRAVVVDQRRSGDDLILFPTEDETTAWYDVKMLYAGIISPEEISRSRFYQF